MLRPLSIYHGAICHIYVGNLDVMRQQNSNQRLAYKLVDRWNEHVIPAIRDIYSIDCFIVQTNPTAIESPKWP